MTTTEENAVVYIDHSATVHRLSRYAEQMEIVETTSRRRNKRRNRKGLIVSR